MENEFVVDFVALSPFLQYSMCVATMTFDTYEFVQTLKEAGLTEQQAKGIAEGMRHVDFEHLVTKNDLHRELAQLKADFFKWAVPLLLGQVALFTAITSAVVGWLFTIMR